MNKKVKMCKEGESWLTHAIFICFKHKHCTARGIQTKFLWMCKKRPDAQQDKVRKTKGKKEDKKK